MTTQQILARLKNMGSPKVKKIKEGFAITAKNSHGIFLTDLRKYAKKIGENDALAIELFDTDVYEARLLASMLFNPKNLTARLMDTWAKTFENWEICDTFCMNLFGKSAFTTTKALEWSKKKAEFHKRAGFVCMVQYSFTNKEAGNEVFEKFFQVIKKHATDERTYVMKSVNWALRQIGKRNKDLFKLACALAEELSTLKHPSARWIGNDALRQLKSPKVYMKNYPKSMYST